MSEPIKPEPPFGDRSSPTQRWTAARYQRNAGYVAQLGLPVVTLLAPQPGERILDLGCGDGALTAAIASAGADVVGIDTAADQVAACRARGLDGRIGDGQNLTFSAEFDAVFSNAALHWMSAADAVIGGVRRALKPGGRFVAEMGGEGNIASLIETFDTVLGARGIDKARMVRWYFPSAEVYGAKLADHGFTVEPIKLFARPTELPAGLAGWLDTFGDSFSSALAPADRDDARAEVIARLAPRLRDADGRWWADYVRLRFAAHLAR